jgi:peptide/nickel transport system substrate-binding protein
MREVDPERAKELLAEAGYPDAFPDPVIPIVSSVLTGNPEFGTMTELLQVYFEEIGLQT